MPPTIPSLRYKHNHRVYAQQALISGGGDLSFVDFRKHSGIDQDDRVLPKHERMLSNIWKAIGANICFGDGTTVLRLDKYIHLFGYSGEERFQKYHLPCNV
jgi:hypothetical protein